MVTKTVEYYIEELISKGTNDTLNKVSAHQDKCQQQLDKLHNKILKKVVKKKLKCFVVSIQPTESLYALSRSNYTERRLSVDRVISIVRLDKDMRTIDAVEKLVNEEVKKLNAYYSDIIAKMTKKVNDTKTILRSL